MKNKERKIKTREIGSEIDRSTETDGQTDVYRTAEEILIAIRSQNHFHKRQSRSIQDLWDTSEDSVYCKN